MTRRRLLGLAAAAAAMPLCGPRLSVRANAAAHRELRFRALRHGSPIGEHRVTFRPDGNRLTVETHVDIAVKVLFFTAFRFKHEAEEVWNSGRLISVKSTTDDNGTLLQVSGRAVADGFRIVGDDGPFLAAAHLLTSNALWDSRVVRESRLIDVQHGGEIGLVITQLGDEQVDTPEGPVRATSACSSSSLRDAGTLEDIDALKVRGVLLVAAVRLRSSFGRRHQRAAANRHADVHRLTLPTRRARRRRQARAFATARPPSAHCLDACLAQPHWGDRHSQMAEDFLGIGAISLVVAWAIMSIALRFYVGYFATYNAATYGSVGGVILLMFWLYLTGIALLVGTEINREIGGA